MSVIDIETKLPHEVCEVMCWKCGTRWIAVYPEGTLLKQLECCHCGCTGYAFKTGQPIDVDVEEVLR